MKERNQVTIGIHRDKYNNLHQMKAALEENLGRRVDWGTYFLTLASPWSVDAIAAVILDSEIREQSDLKVDFEAIADQATKGDVEEIVNKAADRIIKELKKYLSLKTDEPLGEDDEENQPKTFYAQPLGES